MRKLSRLLLVPLALPVTMLTGCQTWGPTWSELTGQRYNVTDLNRRPGDHRPRRRPGRRSLDPQPDPGRAGQAPPGRAGAGAGLGRRAAAARDDAQRRAVQALLRQRAVRATRSRAGLDAGGRLRRADRAAADDAGGEVTQSRRASGSVTERRRQPLLAVESLRVEFPDAPRARWWRCTTCPSTSRPARCSAWWANPAPASRSPARRSSASSIRPGASPAGEIRLDGRRIDNLPYEAMRTRARPRDRRDLPGPAHLAQSAVHGRAAS